MAVCSQENIFFLPNCIMRFWKWMCEIKELIISGGVGNLDVIGIYLKKYRSGLSISR